MNYIFIIFFFFDLKFENILAKSLPHIALTHATLSHSALVKAALVHAALVHATLVHAALVHATLVHAALVHATLILDHFNIESILPAFGLLNGKFNMLLCFQTLEAGADNTGIVGKHVA
eukprot:441153_1